MRGCPNRHLITALPLLLGLTGVLAAGSATGSALIEIDREPIDYYHAPVQDPISQLQEKIERGEATLEYDDRFGYLPSLLKNLAIPVSSQGLVFSQTSFQAKRISPEKPRSIYFNDETYIGLVQDGEVIEISSIDPSQGAIFYSLDTQRVDRPKFLRQTDSCLLCHSSSLTKGVPGHLVRSVFTAPSGQPILNAGTFLTDDSSPLSERWGGWYVTGTHGKARHMGNTFLVGSSDPEEFDREKGANLTDLSARIDTEAYLSPHSDIVALMVLEHQTNLHNLITLGNYQARLALRLQKELNQMENKPEDHVGDSTLRRFGYSSEPLLKAMLFIEEASLESPIAGTSDFSRDFPRKGPRDNQGRSLREFDLQERLFKHRCSYLIYSEAFDALPAPFREYTLARLWEILTGKDRSGQFDRLTRSERKAVHRILSETKSGLPECWKQVGSDEAP